MHLVGKACTDWSGATQMAYQSRWPFCPHVLSAHRISYSDGCLSKVEPCLQRWLVSGEVGESLNVSDFEVSPIAIDKEISGLASLRRWKVLAT